MPKLTSEGIACHPKALDNRLPEAVEGAWTDQNTIKMDESVLGAAKVGRHRKVVDVFFVWFGPLVANCNATYNNAHILISCFKLTA